MVHLYILIFYFCLRRLSLRALYYLIWKGLCILKGKKISGIVFIVGIIVMAFGCFLFISQINKIILEKNTLNVFFELGVKYTEEEAEMYLNALKNDLNDTPKEVAGNVNASDVFDPDNPNMMTIPLAYTDIPMVKENMKTDKKGMIIVSHSHINEIKDICEKYGFEFMENGSEIIVRKEVTFEEYISGTCAFSENREK